MDDAVHIRYQGNNEEGWPAGGCEFFVKYQRAPHPVTQHQHQGTQTPRNPDTTGPHTAHCGGETSENYSLRTPFFFLPCDILPRGVMPSGMPSVTISIGRRFGCFLLCCVVSTGLRPPPVWRTYSRTRCAANLEYERSELRILLGKVLDARAVTFESLNPEVVGPIEECLECVLAQGSPIDPRDLARGSLLTGRWDLAFSTDSRVKDLVSGTALTLALDDRISDTKAGHLTQTLSFPAKYGVRELSGDASYTVTDSGTVAFQFKRYHISGPDFSNSALRVLSLGRVSARIFGFEVPIPLLGRQLRSFVKTTYFDGDLWIESIDNDRALKPPTDLPTTPVVNIWKFAGANHGT